MCLAQKNKTRITKFVIFVHAIKFDGIMLGHVQNTYKQLCKNKNYKNCNFCVWVMFTFANFLDLENELNRLQKLQNL